MEVGGLDRADARAGLTRGRRRASCRGVPARDGCERNVRYEYYSNLALVSSVVVYMLAMFAHAAEWAAARRLTGEPNPLSASWSMCGAADNARPELVVRPEPFDSSGRAEGHHQSGSASGPQDQAAVSRRVEQFGRIGCSAHHHRVLAECRRRPDSGAGRAPRAVGQHVRVHHHGDGLHRRGVPDHGLAGRPPLVGICRSPCWQP